MYRCHHCKNIIHVKGQPDKDAICPRCGWHLRTCHNCRFLQATGCLRGETAHRARSVIQGSLCPGFEFRLAA